jgi:hypothetical protein
VKLRGQGSKVLVDWMVSCKESWFQGNDLVVVRPSYRPKKEIPAASACEDLLCEIERADLGFCCLTEKRLLTTPFLSCRRSINLNTPTHFTAFFSPFLPYS